MTDHVFIAGPASWNRIVVLDHLPEPVPHMQFALEEYETARRDLGGQGARPRRASAAASVLHTLFGADVDGARVTRAARARRASRSSRATAAPPNATSTS